MRHKISYYTIRILEIVIILAGIFYIIQKASLFPLHDYVEYWSAGKINVNHGNPYSPEELISMQHEAGSKQTDALMMWNPPWLLAYIMPFGMLGYSTSRMLWFLLELLFFILSATMLWEIYQGHPKRKWIAWVAVLAFGPTLHALKLGQVTPFILLGVTGLIYFIKKEKPFLAGVIGSLALIKPHLVYLFLIAVLLWSLRKRQWKVLLGIAAGLIVTFSISIIPNKNLVTQYFYAIQHYPPSDWMTATLGAPLRLLFGPEKFYLQFLPILPGIIWLAIYWISNQANWEWSSALPLLISVSLATSAYGWVHDMSLLVVAIVDIARRDNLYKWKFSNGIILVTFWGVSLLNTFLSISQHWFWWLASYFLIWYLLANYLLNATPNPLRLAQVGVSEGKDEL